MSPSPTNVAVLAEGYEVLVREAGIQPGADTTYAQLHHLKRLLTSDGDWSPVAAQELVSLAQRYGIFMLRNALALSVALGIDDGDAGF
jgi:hypothetical protein